MKQTITCYPISPNKVKENGFWAVDFKSLPFPSDFNACERWIVHFPPQVFGGNHKHARIEIFVGLGDGLELVWLDGRGKKHTKKMNPRGKLMLIKVSPFIPHAVINRSKSESADIVEFADGPLNDVENIKVI